MARSKKNPIEKAKIHILDYKPGCIVFYSDIPGTLKEIQEAVGFLATSGKVEFVFALKGTTNWQASLQPFHGIEPKDILVAFRRI
jgi:hypothetical protein